MQRCLGCMREFKTEYQVCPYCGYIVGTLPTAKNQLVPGTVLHERYLIGKVLGQGGFGITYIAWDTLIDRAVAVKEFMPAAFASRLSGEKAVSCFSDAAQMMFDRNLRQVRRETTTMAKFNDMETVVKVFDYFEENKTAYIVMELLVGKTVSQVLRAQQKLPLADTVNIMIPILKTLQAMHAEGLIHRDVAPDNIFLCNNGNIKLLDFGAARLVSGADHKTLSVILKHGFAPKEQYSAKAEQGETLDVYAACATMYNMLTGEKPTDSIDRTGDDRTDLPALFAANIPRRVRNTLIQGLRIDPNSRIRTAELLQTMQGWQNNPMLLRVAEKADAAQSAQEQTPARKGGARSRRAVGAAAVIILAVSFAVPLALNGHFKTKSTKTETTSASTSATDPTTTRQAKLYDMISVQATFETQAQAAYNDPAVGISIHLPNGFVQMDDEDDDFIAINRASDPDDHMKIIYSSSFCNTEDGMEKEIADSGNASFEEFAEKILQDSLDESWSPNGDLYKTAKEGNMFYCLDSIDTKGTKLTLAWIVIREGEKYKMAIVGSAGGVHISYDEIRSLLVSCVRFDG